jgi:hypothetical protein
MIHLNELKEITENKFQRDKEEQLRIEKEINEKFENEYQEVISNLEQRLRDAATNGQRKLAVAHFSAFSGGNVSNLLHKKRGNYGNYYVAWSKTIFESDVIENMQGNLKRVYDYLKENNLNPKVYYWTDGGGQDEGFELVVAW